MKRDLKNTGVILLTLFLLSSVTACCQNDGPGSEFIRSKGSSLVVGADEQLIRLRGVGFVNNVGYLDYSNIAETTDHSEIDFQRVADMGMNVIRFELDYRFFEDDASPYVYQQQGWDWLDQEIGYAKQYGVYLIFDMQIPHGDVQLGPGNALWSDPELQNRLKALWRAIAERYKDEPIVAAYDLVNEPYPTNGHHQWATLAQELVDEIRSVDTNHLIIVEESIGTDPNGLFDFPSINDDNVMYDFHFYHPHRFTHSFIYRGNYGDGGFYPNPDISLTNHYLTADVVWTDEVLTSKVPLGDSDWTLYESGLYEATDSMIVEVAPTFSCNVNQGTVYFDDFTIEEYDPDQNLTRQIHVDIDHEDVWTLPTIDPLPSLAEEWIPWFEEGEQGSHTTVSVGHLGNYALSISGTSQYYSLSNSGFGISVRTGYYYKISGWMKGEGVTDQSGQMGMDFFKHESTLDFTPLDKTYLEKAVMDKVQFLADRNAPINVGEFGTSIWTFRENLNGIVRNRGGLQWVRDMVDLFDQHNINYQYFGYHSHDYGLYTNHGTLPDPASANQELIDLLKELLQ